MNKPTRAHSSRSLSAVEVKSKFGAEFRRFSLDRSKPGRFGDFVGLLQHVHRVPGVELLVGYADVHGDLLPITNDDNFLLAIATATPMLRLFLQRKEDSDFSAFGSDPLSRRKSPGFSAVLLRPEARRKPPVIISLPRDFRPVSSIIDVDVLPESLRRVRLFKHGLHKPLGFYIRDGSSVRVTPQGLQKVPGIFISRMVPGGLAESTGLLAVNDEVLEVNGIEVTGKSLDQVTDMMIANSHNLIITVKPANQRNNVVRHREAGAASGSSGRSSDSGASFYGYGGYGASAVNSGPAHIIQNFPAGEMESDEEEDLVLEPGEEPSIPRYEPHLLLRRDPALSDPALSDPALSDPTLSDPAGPAFSNGTLTASASLGSLTTASGSSPRRARERRSLEEDGTVITL